MIFEIVVENNGLSGIITRHYHHLAVYLCMLGILDHTVLLHMCRNVVAEISLLNNVINTR